MPFRTEIKTKAYMNGRPYTILVVDSPIIDDVLVVEMKLRAAELMNEEDYPAHRVSRDVRDILIKMGVQQ